MSADYDIDPPLEDIDTTLIGRFEQIEKRARRRRIAGAVDVIKALKKAGLPPESAVIEGVPVTFGEPETPKEGTKLAPATDFNEWDNDLGAPSPPSLHS